MKMKYSIDYLTAGNVKKEYEFEVNETNCFSKDQALLITELIPFIKENDIAEVTDIYVIDDEEEEETVIKVTTDNLEEYFFNYDGNLYYRMPDKQNFEIVIDFDVEECREAMNSGVEFIYIEGEAL